MAEPPAEGAFSAVGSQSAAAPAPLDAPPSPDPKKPRMLQSECKGQFPPAAVDDNAKVVVLVRVSAGGVVESVSVVTESPRDQGFGEAARTCVMASRFAPARDDLGNPSPGAVEIQVRFAR